MIPVGGIVCGNELFTAEGGNPQFHRASEEQSGSGFPCDGIATRDLILVAESEFLGSGGDVLSGCFADYESRS